MTAKVINFPESKIVRKAPEFTEALRKEGQTKAVDDLVDYFNENVYNLLMMNGIEETDEFRDKDFEMLSECLRALVYRQFEMKHDFHPMIDEAYTVKEEKHE